MPDHTFNPAQYRQVVDKITGGTHDLSGRLNDLPQAANTVLAAVLPPPVREAILWCVEKLVEIGDWVLDKVIEALKGAAAPVMFYDYAYGWQDLRGTATNVAGQLKPAAMPATGTWNGPAATAYNRVVAPQSDAATKIATIADKTQLALTGCAIAGAAFYVALGVIVVQLIAQVIAAIPLLGSGALSWAGAALLVETVTVSTTMIAAATSTLAALLAAQAATMVTLHGESVDNTAFPGGHWPNATTNTYNDATVTDGDTDWSLRR